VMDRNLRRAAEYTKANGLRFRPHTKTHKLPVLAQRQLQLGATGLTVAKVGEAEIMQQIRPPDMLVAYPILGPSKLRRLMEVAAHVPITVAMDSIQAARQLSDAARKFAATVKVLVEMDAGFGRVGVKPADVTELAIEVSRLPYLEFAGISFFPGHIFPSNGGMRSLEALEQTLRPVIESLERAKLSVAVVSGGSTPTLFHSHLVPSMNEIRSGTYIFNDKNTVVAGGCSYEDCAAYITTTIVSVAKDGQVIIDSGSKMISSDPAVGAGEHSFGYVVDAPQAIFHRMNEEHGYVDVSKTGRHFAVGDRFRIIPNHICVVVNLQEEVYGFRGDTIEQTWTVEARGKLK
jgi:D-serine deaminase-like pyridoxal phosphate-dependent protein